MVINSSSFVPPVMIDIEIDPVLQLQIQDKTIHAGGIVGYRIIRIDDQQLSKQLENQIFEKCQNRINWVNVICNTLPAKGIKRND